MTMDDRYKLLEDIEREYTIFINKLEDLEKYYVKKKVDNYRSPKNIISDQIKIMTICISEKEASKYSDEIDYSYEELKYIFNLVYLNLLSWLENLSDDTKIIYECERGNYDTIEGWFNNCLLEKFKSSNEKLDKWTRKYKKGNL